ncbi:MAG: hypothetical protein ACR2QH_03180 [Geminicoccaceae bacterium]
MIDDWSADGLRVIGYDLPKFRLAASQPDAASLSEGLEIMTPGRTSAEVVDFARERQRLLDDRKQRIQKTMVEIIREMRFEDRSCNERKSGSRPPDDPEPGGDAA